jgi:polysaccharide export outer membrane protein
VGDLGIRSASGLQELCRDASSPVGEDKFPGATVKNLFVRLAALSVAAVLCACAPERTLPPAMMDVGAQAYGASADYRIGPYDVLNIVVWHNPDLSSQIPVRPDGRIALPLAGEVVAAGKTPSDLAAVLQEKLKPFVNDPLVTVTPMQFTGPYARQVRILGEAVQPRAIPFTSNMTLLDAMIAVGGLTKYADGDGAKIVRIDHGVQQTYNVHLDSLIRDGDVSQNVALQPGDVLIIPQRFF